LKIWGTYSPSFYTSSGKIGKFQLEILKTEPVTPKKLIFGIFKFTFLHGLK